MKKLILLTLVLSIFFAGCKKDKGDPPLLPPRESMLIDFSNFETLKKSSDQFSKGTENSSWEFSAITAGFWKGIIGLTLIVPVTSFQMVIDQNPVYVSDKTWEWSYTATIANAAYKARLTGQLADNDVKWKMYVTKEGSFTDFLWFEGTSAYDGKSGSWILNQSNVNPGPIIEIQWTKPDASTGEVTYTYVKNDEYKNSYIKYGLTTNTQRNAFYKIHYWNGSKFSDIDVEWNTTTHLGRVKSIDYMGDNLWHCWDGNKVNTTCLP